MDISFRPLLATGAIALAVALLTVAATSIGAAPIHSPKKPPISVPALTDLPRFLPKGALAGMPALGDDPVHAVFGATYPLADSPLMIAVEKGEYLAESVPLGSPSQPGLLASARISEKLMRLTLLVGSRDPVKIDTSRLRIEAFGLDNKPQPLLERAYLESDGISRQLDLRPGAPQRLVAFVPVDARGEPQRFSITDAESGAQLVFPVDKTHAVRPLDARYADPDDPTKTSVLPTISARPGAAYSGRAFDLAFVSMEPLGTVRNRTAPPGRAWLAARIKLSRRALDDDSPTVDQFAVELTGVSGETLSPLFVLAGGDDNGPKNFGNAALSYFGNGESRTLRFVFCVDASDMPASLRFAERGPDDAPTRWYRVLLGKE